MAPSRLPLLKRLSRRPLKHRSHRPLKHLSHRPVMR
jgi:hypothetical protein